MARAVGAACAEIWRKRPAAGLLTEQSEGESQELPITLEEGGAGDVLWHSGQRLH